MGRKILFPFSISQDNSSAYLQTLQLAEEMTAEVICFTTLDDSEHLDDAYLHLLELNGYFQTISGHWKTNQISVKRAIKVGNAKNEIKRLLDKISFDFILCHPAPHTFCQSFFDRSIRSKLRHPQLITFSKTFPA